MIDTPFTLQPGELLFVKAALQSRWFTFTGKSMFEQRSRHKGPLSDREGEGEMKIPFCSSLTYISRSNFLLPLFSFLLITQSPHKTHHPVSHGNDKVTASSNHYTYTSTKVKMSDKKASGAAWSDAEKASRQMSSVISPADRYRSRT